MITLELTPRQVEVIRLALRQQEETHKRNGFTVLQGEASALRSHISDVLIDIAQGVSVR